MAETMDPRAESHHLAAGVTYLVLAAIPVAVLLTWHPNASYSGSLVWILTLGFLSGCDFYRGHFGSDSLPDGVERARRMTTYAAGIWATIVVVMWIVISVDKLI